MSLCMGMIRNVIPACVTKHEFANHLAQIGMLPVCLIQCWLIPPHFDCPSTCLCLNVCGALKPEVRSSLGIPSCIFRSGPALSGEDDIVRCDPPDTWHIAPDVPNLFPFAACLRLPSMTTQGVLAPSRRLNPSLLWANTSCTANEASQKRKGGTGEASR